MSKDKIREIADEIWNDIVYGMGNYNDLIWILEQSLDDEDK